jgi:anaerobic magnesium-protoporphyrin IX monomethyl ester cyclase
MAPAEPKPVSPPRFLFVVPPWRFHRGNVWRHVMGIIPPVGMATLAAVLEREGVAQVEILDAQALGLDGAQTAAEVARRAPDWVGLGPGTTLAQGAYDVARRVRALLPGARIVMGGPHPAALPAEPFERGMVDFVLVGEAETTLPRLVRGDTPQDIAGLVWRGPDGALRSNPPPPLIEDLDTLPDPAFDKLPIRRYRPSLGNYRHLPSLGITMTRGCYGNCTFCSRLLFGTRVRTFGTARVVGLVESLRDRYGLREIQFYDDIFLGTKRRIHEFCEAMIERRVGVSWACFMRAELTDRETARLMRRAGCYLVDFGIESGDEAVLEAVHKKVALQRTLQAVEAFRAEGVLLKCGFILGFPGESRASMHRTLDLAVRLAPHAAVFNLATPYPGTELFRQCEADGTLLSRDWDLYDQAHPLIALPDTSPDELLALYREAHRRFYLRPAAVLRWARVLRSPEQTAMAARAFGGLLRFLFLDRGT